MSRPEYLRCPMTPGIIRRIREEQEYYDRDPERYEREERRKQEERELEQQREREAVADYLLALLEEKP